jgi:hypothetical protein
MIRTVFEVPVDFTELDVRFLPYYLTAEKVGIEWDDVDEFIIANHIKEFYVGINFTEGYYTYTNIRLANERVRPISFMRLPNKNSKSGFVMESKLIIDVFGLGIYNPNIQPNWSREDVIKNKLAIFKSIRRDYPNWINHRGFFQALDEYGFEGME